MTVSLQMHLLHRLHLYSSLVLGRTRGGTEILPVTEHICSSCNTSRKDIKCFLISSCKMACFLFSLSCRMVMMSFSDTSVLVISYTLVLSSSSPRILSILSFPLCTCSAWSEQKQPVRGNGCFTFLCIPKDAQCPSAPLLCVPPNEHVKELEIKFFYFLFFYFFKDFIYIFLERGREGEREREKHQCVVVSMWPPLRTWPTTQARAPTGNQTSDPLVCSRCSIH